MHGWDYNFVAIRVTVPAIILLLYPELNIKTKSNRGCIYFLHVNTNVFVAYNKIVYVCAILKSASQHRHIIAI